MSSSHDYEATVMYGALIEPASWIRWFSGFERLLFSGFARELPRRASFHPRRYGVSMSQDEIAVLKERILVKTTPVSYPTFRLHGLEPSGDWKQQEDDWTHP